jgi:hypothetical protein
MINPIPLSILTLPRIVVASTPNTALPKKL